MSAEYELVVGLEIHAELNTKTKIFCGCKNEFGAEPNSLCCPVCLGFPGAIPRLNEQVVFSAVMMGLALGCHINKTSKMERKHYIYPDLPKGYQISQQDLPLCESGEILFSFDGKERCVHIERIHIEEDAGKLAYDKDSGLTKIDYNRAGVPLIEIVSAPDLRSANEAKAYMENISLILIYLGISDVKMQEGNLRADVNVSLRKKGELAYGTRVEMKNINSFGAVQRAIIFEETRQRYILNNGGKIQQETRRWDNIANNSTLLRSKVNAQDYRFLIDGDLLPFCVETAKIQELKKLIPELPNEKIKRLVAKYGLTFYQASLLAEQKDRADFFEQSAMLALCSHKAIANWLLGEVLKELNERKVELVDTKLTPQNLSKMLAMVETEKISGTAAKTVLNILMNENIDPETVAKKENLMQVNDDDKLYILIQKVLQENPQAVRDYNSGKVKVLGFIVGQCMKAAKGQANPEKLATMVKKEVLRLQR